METSSSPRRVVVTGLGAVTSLGHDVETFWAGLLFGALSAGSGQLQVATATPPDLVQVLQALVVLFIAAPGLIRLVFRLRRSKAGGSAVLAKGWNG